VLFCVCLPWFVTFSNDNIGFSFPFPFLLRPTVPVQTEVREGGEPIRHPHERPPQGHRFDPHGGTGGRPHGPRLRMGFPRGLVAGTVAGTETLRPTSRPCERPQTLPRQSQTECVGEVPTSAVQAPVGGTVRNRLRLRTLVVVVVEIQHDVRPYRKIATARLCLLSPAGRGTKFDENDDENENYALDGQQRVNSTVSV
jgi:hypothetical protein